MRIKLIFAAVFAIALSTVAAQADGSWCANCGNATNCGFYSFEQCQATVSCLGGFCSLICFRLAMPSSLAVDIGADLGNIHSRFTLITFWENGVVRNGSDESSSNLGQERLPMQL
jgi:hypothetical protein